MTRCLLWLSWTDALERIYRRRFLAVTALAAVLALISVRIGSRELADRREEAQHLVSAAEASEGLLSGRQLQPAFRVVRQPEPLSVFVRGLEASAPTAWDFSASGAHPNAPAPTAGVQGWTISLDLEFVVRIVLSLLALLSAIDGPRGQRTNEVLRDLRSLPISAPVAVGSQVLGGLLATAMAAAIVFAAMCVGGGGMDSGRSLGTLAGFLGMAVVYASIFFLIGLHIALPIARVQSAMAAGVVVWAILTLAVPPVLDLAQFRRGQTPVALGEADLQKQFDLSVRSTEKRLGETLVALAGSRRDWEALLNVPAVREQLETLWRDSVAERRLESLHPDPRPDPWTPFLRWLSLASPATLLSSAMTRLADTGAPSLDRWSTAIDERRRQLNRLYFDDPARVTVRIPATAGGELLSFVRHEATAPASVPKFEIPGRSDWNRWQAAIVPFAELLVVSALLILWLLYRGAAVA